MIIGGAESALAERNRFVGQSANGGRQNVFGPTV